MQMVAFFNPPIYKSLKGGVLVGEDALPLKSYLMKPYRIGQRKREFIIIEQAEHGELLKMYLVYWQVDFGFFSACSSKS